MIGAPSQLRPVILGIEELQFGATGRIQVFDQFRGLLLFWMILGHAYYLTGQPQAFPLAYLRLGSATASFVMLTGFVIAWIYVPRPLQSKSLIGMSRRALFIFGVAYVSNLTFAIARDLALGQASLESWIQMAMFQQTWTISGILVATALSIIAAIALLPLVKLYGSERLLFCATLLLIAMHCCRHLELAPVTWVDMMMGWTVFGRSLLDLTLLSAWAFCLSAFLSNRRPGTALWAATVLVSIAIYLACRNQVTLPILCSVSRAPAQFVVSMWLASLIGLWIPAVATPLGVLGRQSLTVFLLHRVVLQVTMVVAGSHLRGAHGTWILIAITSGICLLVASVIELLQKSGVYQALTRRRLVGA